MLVPSLGGDNMQAVLAVFRGEATLGDAPDQVIEATPETSLDITAVPAGRRFRRADTDPGATTPESATTTLPSVIADQNEFGFVPDKNISC